MALDKPQPMSKGWIACASAPYSGDGMLNEATVEAASSSFCSTLEVGLGITASKRNRDPRA